MPLSCAGLLAEPLSKELGPNATHRGWYFYGFVGLAVSVDVAGLILTLVLAHRLRYDRYAYVSNLLPPLLSMGNTLCTAYI